MSNISNRTLLIFFVLLVGIFAALQIPSNQKQALHAYAQPAISEAEQGLNYLRGITPTSIPTVIPTPFVTPTNLPIPPELVEAFNAQAAEFEVVFTDRSGSLVTDPAMPAYTPNTGQGSAYDIPLEAPPAETEFCQRHYSEWKKYPHVYSFCPILVEAFEAYGLSPMPSSGVNNSLLTIDKMLAQATQESAGDPHVVSYAGAAGYGQIMPSNGFIDLNYANSCDQNGKNCKGGKKNPPDTPEARQAYIDFYTTCSNGVNKFVNQKYGRACNNPNFMFDNRPTVEELFGAKANIFWQTEHMKALTGKNGFINALTIYYRGNLKQSAPEYTGPICSMLASNSDEACR